MTFARCCKQRTIHFFTLYGWWELKLKYCPVNVGLRYTDVLNPCSVRDIRTFRNGRQMWRQIEKSYQKLARISNLLTFLHRCRDLQLIPSGLAPRLPVNSRRARLVVEKAGCALVRKRIQYNRWIKQGLHAHISQRLEDFFNRIPNEEDQRRIQNDLDKFFRHEFDVVKAHQVQKLNRF